MSGQCVVHSERNVPRNNHATFQNKVKLLWRFWRKIHPIFVVDLPFVDFVTFSPALRKAILNKIHRQQMTGSSDDQDNFCTGFKKPDFTDKRVTQEDISLHKVNFIGT